MSFLRLLTVALPAALLAACAQNSVVSHRSEHVPPHLQTSLNHNRQTPVVTDRVVAAAKKHIPFSSDKNAAAPPATASGLASFYTEGTQTANGERFNTHAFTAAHPTLPFGTRLRVTNLATGRQVIVRVNDRGPFVAGRVVDLSYSAAENLGMVGRGIAKVKLDVVE
jgi:rare lipoprotein A